MVLTYRTNCDVTWRDSLSGSAKGLSLGSCLKGVATGFACLTKTKRFVYVPNVACTNSNVAKTRLRYGTA